MQLKSENHAGINLGFWVNNFKIVLVEKIQNLVKYLKQQKKNVSKMLCTNICYINICR